MAWRRGPCARSLATVDQLLDGLLLAVPGLLTVYLAFTAGGCFPGATAFAALALIALLILRVTLSQTPFAGFSRPLGVAVVALSLFAVWILVSATWSDAPARALLDFDRTLLYLLALVLMGTIPRSSARLRWIVRGIALGITAVAAVALVTRLYAATFPTTPNLGNLQLSFPLGYSNALGLLSALGAILCFHLTTSLREPLPGRMLAASALPVLVPTVYFTLSRGAIGAGAIGVVAYVVLARPRGFLTGVIAAAPSTTLAVAVAYRAHLLATDDFAGAGATVQGHHVAAIVAGCALAALVLRGLLAPLDARLGRLSLPADLRGPVTRSAWAVAVLATLAVVFAVQLPQRVVTYTDRFLNSESIETGKSRRDRLFTVENHGLPDNWEVALRGFGQQELHG